MNIYGAIDKQTGAIVMANNISKNSTLIKDITTIRCDYNSVHKYLKIKLQISLIFFSPVSMEFFRKTLK